MDDFDSISDAIYGGNLAELTGIALRVADFPLGDGGPTLHLRRHWITIAIDIGSIDVIAWMIDQGAPLRFRDDEGYAPLHSCIDRERGDRHEVLALLIEAGADVNAQGPHTWTPLHQAAIRDDQRAMKMLLDAGADTLRRTTIDNYATPAEEALKLGHAASADFIERYAANRYPFNDV